MHRVRSGGKCRPAHGRPTCPRPPLPARITLFQPNLFLHSAVIRPPERILFPEVAELVSPVRAPQAFGPVSHSGVEKEGRLRLNGQEEEEEGEEDDDDDDMLPSHLVSVALFFLVSTGVSGFSVTTTNADVRVKENEGTDLTCSYSADFGSNPRVEWKFKDLKGSQIYVIFDGKPTAPYSSRVTMYGSNLRFSKVTRKDNGVYNCEVSGNSQFGESKVKLTVLVPPSPPLCRVPTSVTTGTTVQLSCHDTDGSPPPTYRWYKDNTLLPPEPNKISGFKNATYRLNTVNGNLEFPKATKMDSGQYYCEAVNDAGPPQSCRATKMEVRDVNTGGIVAGVIVVLLLLVLLGVGIWYANKRGYLPKKSESKPKPSVVYQPTSGGGDDEEDGEFKQKSSFVV